MNYEIVGKLIFKKKPNTSVTGSKKGNLSSK